MQNDRVITVVRCIRDEVLIEVCHGPIPDEYRTLKFPSNVEKPSQDAKVSAREDDQFFGWLDYYRDASLGESKLLLDDSCL